MDEAENTARLAGLFAMLALPMVKDTEGRYRRRLIEVEIAPDRWAAVEGASIDARQLILWAGANGTRVQYAFPLPGGCPRWRADRPEQKTYIDGTHRGATT